MVIIDHGGGVFTGYAHMSERHAVEGDFVAQGDLIGIEGATGLVTGAHLHWEVAVGGVLVDGLRWVNGSQGF
jgi:murein DD-endopeptidase MepM/ murein hydrolase activator NlpD